MSTPCVQSGDDGITNTTILIVVNIVVSTILGLATAMRCRFKWGDKMFSFKPKDAGNSPGSVEGNPEPASSKSKTVELERTISSSHVNLLRNAVAIVYEGIDDDDIEAQRHFPVPVPASVSETVTRHKYHPSAGKRKSAFI